MFANTNIVFLTAINGVFGAQQKIDTDKKNLELENEATKPVAQDETQTETSTKIINKDEIAEKYMTLIASDVGTNDNIPVCFDPNEKFETCFEGELDIVGYANREQRYVFNVGKLQKHPGLKGVKDVFTDREEVARKMRISKQYREIGELKDLDADTVQCFAGDTLVTTPDDVDVPMSSLSIGQNVLTVNGFEPIIGFLHAQEHVEADFLEIATPSGSLAVTADHLVFNNSGEAVPAKHIKTGDVLSSGKVSKVANVTRNGIFAPLTASGTIIVNGVTASTYAHVDHSLAHWVVSPMRVFALFNMHPKHTNWQAANIQQQLSA